MGRKGGVARFGCGAERERGGDGMGEGGEERGVRGDGILPFAASSIFGAGSRNVSTEYSLSSATCRCLLPTRKK